VKNPPPEVVVAVAASLAVALAPVSAAGASAPRCAARPIREANVAVPAPIRITTRCAAYVVRPNGGVEIAAPPRSPGAGISWMEVAGDGAPVVQRGSRIAVVRDGREAWRSHGRFRAAGVFALLGSRAVVFGYDDYSRGRSRTNLFVAPLGGRERRIAADEYPLGWTRAGKLLTWRSRGQFRINLRAADGTLLRRVGGRLRAFRFDQDRGTLLAITRSRALVQYDDRWRRLADLRRLGFEGRASLAPLRGGLIGIVSERRVAVLRGDGSLFARASFPHAGRGVSVAGDSGLVAEEDGSGVAFAVTRRHDGNGRVGRETVYVLRAGARRPTIVHTSRMRYATCERSVVLAWRGRWLLYSTTEGRTLALDTRRPRRLVELTGLVRRVARRQANGKVPAQVAWAGGPR
jgi:hypothetical protein